MKKIFSTITFCFTILLIQAQPGVTDFEAQQQIKKLGFLVGNWEGAGWTMREDRQRHDFSQTEKVQFKLDSTAILVEGMGRSNGAVIHDALAIITYDKQKENYTFKSNLSSGHGGTFEGEIIDGKFYWYPNERMRYIIDINEKGQWYEIGELNNNGTWIRFLEMTLDKK